LAIIPRTFGRASELLTDSRDQAALLRLVKAAHRVFFLKESD